MQSDTQVEWFGCDNDDCSHLKKPGNASEIPGEDVAWFHNNCQGYQTANWKEIAAPLLYTDEVGKKLIFRLYLQQDIRNNKYYE